VKKVGELRLANGFTVELLSDGVDEPLRGAALKLYEDDGRCWECGRDVEVEAANNVYCLHCLAVASDPFGDEGIPLG
jgi:hypothetical protein